MKPFKTFIEESKTDKAYKAANLAAAGGKFPQENLPKNVYIYERRMRPEYQAYAHEVKNGPYVGAIAFNSARLQADLYALSAFDKTIVPKNLKPGEMIFRYVSHATNGTMSPFVKVNVYKGLYYSLTEKSSSGEIDDVVFETKGVKAYHLAFDIGYYPDFMKDFNIL